MKATEINLYPEEMGNMPVEICWQFFILQTKFIGIHCYSSELLKAEQQVYRDRIAQHKGIAKHGRLLHGIAFLLKKDLQRNIVQQRGREIKQL